jgi:hyperosmotically inducible periplasmic protein
MIKSKLLLNHRTSGLSIHVKTNNAVVTLEGDVASLSEKQLSEKIASHVKGVNRVINNLQIKS